MAHTLTIYDTQSTTSIDLASATTPGIVLRSYATQQPRFDVSYLDSMYSAGGVPQFAKTRNVVETIIVDIYGSSADDALAKLRSITQAITDARSISIDGGGYTWKELRYKPQSSTNTCRAQIFGGEVTPPSDFHNTQWNSSLIENVVITIERAPFWEPVTFPATNTSAVAGSNYFVENTFTSIAGDFPARVRRALINYAPTGAFTAIMGIASEKRYGAGYDDLGLSEAESHTLGTDTASAVDAAGLGGNTAAISFATATAHTLRITQTIQIANHVRVLARVKVSVGTTYCGISVRGTHAIGQITTPTKSFNNTTYQWLDLGSINFKNFDGATDITQLWFYVSRTAGAGTCSIDAIAVIPNLISAKGRGTDQIDLIDYYEKSLTGSAATLTGTIEGELTIPTGNSVWYTLFMATDGTWPALPGSVSSVFSVEYSSRYISARGAT